MTLSQKDATGPMAIVQKEARRLISLFDKKPILKKCFGHNCSNIATRCTVYNINVEGPFWWCDTCDPYQRGALGGKLQALITYSQAISHVDMYCRGRKEDYQSIIRSMAEAKGLPARVGKVQAAAFFTT
jgi:hypothetical protein